MDVLHPLENIKVPEDHVGMCDQADMTIGVSQPFQDLPGELVFFFGRLIRVPQ